MTGLATDKAQTLRELGRNTAYTLRDAARHLESGQRREILALSARINYCNDPANTWVGEDLHNHETGELFDGFGRYWHCSSKFCSFCLRQNSRRNRLTLRAAIEAQTPSMSDKIKLGKDYKPKPGEKTGLRTGEHYRFITLTFPNLGLKIPPTRAIINHAWALLRKREFFRRAVVGGAKAEEFTVTGRGYHYHMHILARTRTIKANDLRWEWTDCVKKAFAAFCVDFVAPTSDGLLIANIKIVHDLNKVTNEVTKYITKANSWWNMPTDHLVEVALIPKWHRMFEVFGSFRRLDTEKLNKQLRDPSDEFPKNKLWEDNDELSHPRNHWRLLIKSMSLAKYLRQLHAEVNETIRRRSALIQQKFQWATITQLDTG